MSDRLGRAAVTLLVTAVLAGAAAGCGSPAETASPTPAPSRTDTTSAPAHALPAADPLTVTIPSIGVRTGRLIELGLTKSGEMEVPSDAVTTGWFKVGPTPGEVGPAIIAAHVNYRGVPGAFTRLHEMEPGEEVTVERADGVPARFSVYLVERFPKSRFPTERIYGDTDAPELRLITCGGEFDRATRNYLDNVVVFARLVGP
jgi:sortase family protein